MKDNIDKNYAEAIFSLLKDKNLLEKSYEDIKSIKEYFNDDELIKVLSSYFIDLDSKYKVIDNIFKNYDKTLIDSIKLIIKKHRINKINTILSELITLMNQEFNYLEGIIFSVDKMDEKDIDRIEESLSKKYNQKVSLVNKIDSSLIGGFKILIENNLYDYSIINSLNEMRNKLMR